MHAVGLRWRLMKDSREAHLRLCASRNVKVALLYVFFCGGVMLLTGGPPHRTQGSDTMLRIGLLVGTAILVQFFISVKCVRERIVLGAITISLAGAFLLEIQPLIARRLAGFLRIADDLLWGVALIVSVSMFISSIRARRFQRRSSG